MKAVRNVGVFVVALAAMVAFSLAPAFAFADPLEAGASDVTSADTGESGAAGGDAASGAGDVVANAVASETAVADAGDGGLATTPTWDGNVPIAGETDASAEGAGSGNDADEGGVASDGDEAVDGDGTGDGNEAGDGDEAGAVAGGEPDSPGGIEAGEGGDDIPDCGASDEPGNLADSDEDGDGALGSDIDTAVEGNQESTGNASPGSEEADESSPLGETGAAADEGDDTSVVQANQDAGNAGEQGTTVPNVGSKASDADSTVSPTKAAIGESATAVLTVASSEGGATAKSAQVDTQSKDDQSVTLGPLEIAIAKNLIEGALYGSASGTFSWTASHLLNSMFGGMLDDGTAAKLHEILQKLDEIEDSINTLKTNAERIQMQNIMNDLKYLFSDPTVYTIYKSLQDIEDDLASGQITPAEAEKSRLAALTSDINITEDQWGSINTDFDQYVNTMWEAMTGPYDVTVEDKREQLTLMQTHYELLRRSYKWEHQSYNEWSFFQGRCVSLLMATLTLERASLQARIDLLLANDRKHEAYGIGERLDLITDWIRQAAGYKVVLPDGVQVVYPGIFSDETWASQYWMFKERDEEERYYWVPGHEIVFYAEVNTQHVPQENKNGGLDYPSTLKGLKWNSSNLPYPKFNFWKPFVRYQGGDTLLASADQLKTIFKDYGSDTHLYTIFMSEDEGNFKGLDIDGNSTWWFVVDPDSDHPLEYCPHLFRADRLRCYVLSSGGASTDTAILCYYHNQYTEPDKYTHYIGVGVKRVGPEVYNPTGNKQTPQPVAEIYTAVRFDDDWAQWWPSRGDLALDYEGGTHGSVDQVLVDGQALDPSYYTVVDGRVVLSKEYLARLGYGQHEFFLDTESGGHTITFTTQADGVYYAKSGDGSTWTTGSDADLTFVFKRTENDDVTFNRLVDVLVDGCSVPAWGYVAKAGSAIVNLTAAFLDTLAPGIHTLTAVFEDGNNPQVTFTVRAASTAPQVVPISYADEDALALGTPKTGDPSVLPMALLAVAALASASVAVAARRRA